MPVSEGGLGLSQRWKDAREDQRRPVRRELRDTSGAGCGPGYRVEKDLRDGSSYERSGFFQAGGAGDETGDFGGREFFGLAAWRAMREIAFFSISD